MVCKRSLYCWKNGPCASDQTRKQIWEDNIRFRESLRCMNQSDHYWSFQVANNNCLCPQEDYPRQLANRKYLTGSLQRLDRIDCASVTHDQDIKRPNWPRHNDTEVLCPLHLCPDIASSEMSMPGDQMLAPLERRSILKPSRSEFSKNPLPLSSISKVKLSEDLPKYCPRYKNTLTNIPLLKPCMKIKFSSQPTLLSDKKRHLQVKKNFPSSEEIQTHAEAKSNDMARYAPSNIESQPKSSMEVKKNFESQSRNNLELKRRDIQSKSNESLPQAREPRTRRFSIANSIIDDLDANKYKVPQRQIYTPISRTTRRMLNSEKKIPFVTFGCNNVNSDVGSKRTHNVLAAEHEVFPNALSAKQQRQDMILKFLKSEKDFQKSLLPDDFKKKLINHSSVWANEHNRKIKDTNCDLNFNKNSKKIPPLNDKRLKSQSLIGREPKSLPPSKVFRRPKSQAYFY